MFTQQQKALLACSDSSSSPGNIILSEALLAGSHIALRSRSRVPKVQGRASPSHNFSHTIHPPHTTLLIPSSSYHPPHTILLIPPSSYHPPHTTLLIPFPSYHPPLTILLLPPPLTIPLIPPSSYHPPHTTSSYHPPHTILLIPSPSYHPPHTIPLTLSHLRANILFLLLYHLNSLALSILSSFTSSPPYTLSLQIFSHQGSHLG